MIRFQQYLFPYPLLSFTILSIWLILSESLGLGSFILGFIFSIAGGKAYALLDPPKAHMRKVLVIGRLFFRVLWDIIQSNYDVIKNIIQGLFSKKERSCLQSGFLDIPLELKDKNALAVLAIIVASTPGTLWINYEPGSGVLIIHVLNLFDEEAWRNTIKLRYEKPLMEIFEHG